jgi:ribonuclease R
MHFSSLFFKENPMPKRPASDTWQDPHATREADRYENPIPSREFILELLDKGGQPLTTQQIAAHFKLFDEEREEALRRRLGAMVRDGQIEANRRGAYTPLAENALIKGRVSGHPDGFGFLIPEDGSADLLLTSREMRRVFHGDIVLAREAGYDHKGRREGQIVRVVEKRMKSLVGRYHEDAGNAYVISDNPRVTQEITITGSDLVPSAGQCVTVEVIDYPTNRTTATGRVTEILGDFLAPGMEIDIAIRNFEIPHVWPVEVEREAARIDPLVQEEDKLNRVDLRDLPLATIDGEDARDFDDAVYCEKRRGGFRLIVAIADVSHYVRTGSALNEEALKRGNSVYFPQQVVPMLPEALSNGLCSLNPHVDRLCMVCDMNISTAGRVTDYKFYEAVMHSQARLTYNKVSDLLEHPDTDAGKKVASDYANVVAPVQRLYELFKVLRVTREKRGALDFDSNETRIIFGTDRKIEKIVPVTRNKAHMLIEECMLAANVCAADYVAKNKLPALYRNHEGPRDEKLSKLRNYLGALGIPFTAGKKPKPADFQAVLEKIQDRPDAHVIQTMLLRSLTQAVYAPENLGHFGLAYEAYGHFTSPIRRYPDLLLHRVIRAKLRGERTVMQAIGAGISRMRGQPQAKKPASDAPDMGQMLALGEHCSMTERRADEATRDVMAWLKCEYMREHVGEEFDGVIAGVTTFGVFVELTDIYVEGLVHISNLKGDYYEFDATMQKLVGSKSGVQFALGDTVRIKVAAVNLDSRKMDFDLVDGGSKHRKSGTEKTGGRSATSESGRGREKAATKSGGGGSVRERLRSGDIPSKGDTRPGARKTGAGKTGSRKPKPSSKKPH